MRGLDKGVMLLLLSVVIFFNQITIGATPILSYYPHSHDFGDMQEGQTDSTTFEIWNSGCSCAKLIYTLNESCDWVNVTPTSGSSRRESDVITVNINTTGLSAGIHICNISIESNAGKKVFSVEVNVIIPPFEVFMDCPNSSVANSPIQFSSNVSGGVSPYTWLWDFGDGNVSYEKNPLHQYADDGIYNVTLIVTDDNGLTNTTHKLITILNAPPTANFNYTPINPSTNDIIQFIDLSEDDGSIVNYTWDFGDGNVSYERNASHFYAKNGTYVVSLRVMDDDGAINTTLKNIVVVSLNHAPDAPSKPSGPSHGYAGISYSFSTFATDIDGDKIKYYFDWGDGTGTWTDFIDSGQIVKKKHTWNPGNYNVKVKAQDEHGAESEWSKIRGVIITAYAQQPLNQPPNCFLSVNLTSGYAPLSVTFSMNSSDIDGLISSWILDIDNDGIPEYSGSGNPPLSIQYTYQNAGTYTAKLIVTDDNEATANASVMIIVSEVPVANFDYMPISPVKVGEILNFTDNSTDEDGYIVNYTWNFGDGTIAYGKMANHIYNKTGIYNVTLTVKDNDGNMDSYTITVKVEDARMPGFEFSVLFVAVAILLFFMRKK